MKKFNIELAGKSFEIRLGFRALMAYEQMTDKSYTDIKTLQDTLIYFFCCLISSNQECGIEWDQFVDLCDEDPNALAQFLAGCYEKNKEAAEGK